MRYFRYFKDEWNVEHIKFFSQIGNIQSVKIIVANYFHVSQIGNTQNIRYTNSGNGVRFPYEQILQCITDKIFRTWNPDIPPHSNSVWFGFHSIWFDKPYTLNEQVKFLNEPTDLVINIDSPYFFTQMHCDIHNNNGIQQIYVRSLSYPNFVCNVIDASPDVCENYIKKQIILLFIMSMHDSCNTKTYEHGKIKLVERVFADSFLVRTMCKY